MSCDLYTVRVFFEGYDGCVKALGVYRHINSPPVIPGLPKLTAIDYAPEVMTSIIMPHCGERRDMTKSEIAAVNDWLDAVKAGA